MLALEMICIENSNKVNDSKRKRKWKIIWFNPPFYNPPVQYYTNTDIDYVIKNDQSVSNLSEREQKLLEELKARDNIETTKANKAGAVVILDAKDYVKQCERQFK